MSEFEVLVKDLKTKKFELIVLENKIDNCRFLSSPQFRERTIGGVPSDLEEKYAQYCQLIREWRHKQTEITEIENRIGEYLEHLTKTDDKIIIQLYYVQGLTLFQISQKMNYSYGYVRQIKSQAYKKLCKMSLNH